MKKNNTDTRTLIQEMRDMLGTKKLTLEGLVYGEDGEEMMGDANVPEDEMSMGQPSNEPRQQQPSVGGKGESQIPVMGQQEENPLDGDPEITELITNIRVMTLKGLTKLANNPETAQYDLLKKIFLQIDKSVEDKVDPEK